MPLGAVIANFLNNYTEPVAETVPRRQESAATASRQESAATTTRQEGQAT